MASRWSIKSLIATTVRRSRGLALGSCTSRQDAINGSPLLRGRLLSCSAQSETPDGATMLYRPIPTAQMLSAPRRRASILQHSYSTKRTASSVPRDPDTNQEGSRDLKKRTGSGTPKAVDAADEMVPGPLGEPRKKQRLDVEFGTFHEFTAINKTGGKLFEASQKLIPVEDAVVFPPLKVSCLQGGQEQNFPERLRNRVSLVGIFHRQFGYGMMPTWVKPFEKTFGSLGGMTPSTIQLSLLESWPLRLLKPILVHMMGRGLSPEKRASFFYHFGSTDELRKVLGITNRLTLYVLLVDHNGRIRWRATGSAKPDEIDSLIRCTRQLAEGSGVDVEGRKRGDTRRGRGSR